ncbi:MAG TPA: SDR family oxidoreductase [Jatrophihabitantaceae bacterium]|nr:SDR family oxidoreductase [Jatrophihabitantaceae bacterium]
MAPAFDYADRVALVTGGTKGIGRVIGERFADAGATVVVCGRNAPEQLGAAAFVACDVRDPDQVGAMVEQIVTTHGRLDVVVNNAGGSPSAEAATASSRFSEAIIKLNLLGPLFVAQAANHVMQSQDEGGSIVNIASISGLRPSPNTAAYGAAKAGLLNLTQTLAMEWAPKVRVNAVTAGLIETELAHLFYGDEAAIERVAATVPMGRMGAPDDIASACLFLASPAAGFVTGANLVVHGGGERPPYIEAVQSSG